MADLKLTEHGTVTAVLPDWDAAKGKTIISVVDEYLGYENYRVFRFTDGTAILLRYRHTDYDGYFDAEPDAAGGMHFEDQRTRVALGVDSMATYETNQRLEKEKYEAQRIAQERATLEQLKKKYG